VQRVYCAETNTPFEKRPSPKDIYEIGMGNMEGNKAAALKAYATLGESVGDSLSQAITLIDGLIVVGGGVAGAHNLFMPSLIGEMNGTYETPAGEKFPRLALKTYNLEDEKELSSFLTGDKKEIKVPMSDKTVVYDPFKRIAVGVSQLGTSKAISIGAYAFALNALDKEEMALKAY
jgi:glucokinase